MEDRNAVISGETARDPVMKSMETDEKAGAAHETEATGDIGVAGEAARKEPTAKDREGAEPMRNRPLERNFCL